MPDVTPPHVDILQPLSDAFGVPVNAPIEFNIVDAPEGSAAYTSITLAQNFALPPDDLSAQVNGITAIFTTSVPYEAGTLEILLGGTDQTGQFTETNPDLGIFTMSGVPLVPEIPLIAKYVIPWDVNSVDISTVVIKFGATTVFQNATWQAGYDGTIEPIDFGYHFTVTTHPDFPYMATIVVSVDGADLAEPPNTMPTFTWSFDVLVPNRTPYIANPNPINGTINVARNTNISFQILTDVSPPIQLATINVFINGTQIVTSGVDTSPDYTTTLTPILLGYQIVIDPVVDLQTQLYRIDANALDTLNVYGEGYFEFSTDNYDYVLQLNPYTPLDCPYDTMPDPYITTAADVHTNRYFNKLSSLTAKWAAKGVIENDILKINTSTTSGEFIVKQSLLDDAITYEKPRDTVTGLTALGYRRRRFSAHNTAKATSNSAITYTVTKMWGDTPLRYFAGYPSALDFPVAFTLQPSAALHARVDAPNAGTINDLGFQPPTTVHVSKRNYLRFSMSANAVAGVNFDRYSLGFPNVATVRAGARELFQFSIDSMDGNSEVYFGLGHNGSEPGLDGNNRSGVTLRRVGDTIYFIVYHGTTSSIIQTTGIPYTHFTNKLWLGELEIVDVGSTCFKLYDFESNLGTPVVAKTVLGGGNVASNRFTVTAIGNADALPGARIIGSLYYVDVEFNPSVGPSYVPYALPGPAVMLTDAKWRPYANVLPMTFTPTSELKTIQAKSLIQLGAESSVVTEYHVMDDGDTLANIDSLTPETLVEVLPVEDPSTVDVNSPNANIYRRSTLTYETLDETAGILFMSKAGGPAGDLRSVEIIKPGPSTTFSITLTPTPGPLVDVLHIAITLATNSSGSITTTIQQIVDAVEANTDSPVDTAPAGITSHIAEPLGYTNLHGGKEYKVSSGSRFNELTLRFRSNKTGTYYVSMNDSTSFGGFSNSALSVDGTFTTVTPIFQPTDVNKTIHISSALNPTNVGTYTIVAVLNSAMHEYPTNVVMLNRTDFIAETNTLTWFLNSRGYLIASGRYSRINNPQTVALLTQDFNNLADGTRTLNVSVCKNMLIDDGAQIESDSTLVLNN